MAAPFTVIAPTQDAISDKSMRINANGNGNLILYASGLAGVEEMVPYVGGSNGWTPIYDAAGDQIKLTATKPQATLPCGAHYAIDKTATAADAGLDASINHFTQ